MALSKWRPKEHELQFSSAALFFGSKKNPPALRKDWRAWHTPNGEHRNAIIGAKLKRMGVLPGVPDWTLISPKGRAHFIELKREGKRKDLSDAQWDFNLWATLRGIPYAIAATLEEVVLAAQSWGALDPGIKI